MSFRLGALATRASCATAIGMAAACLNPRESGNLVPETVAERGDLPSFALSDGSLLHLQEFGDPNDPTVVVVHGGPGADHRLLLALEPLASEFHLVFWDQRGTGLSERVDPSIIGHNAVPDVFEILEAFSPDERVHVIGYSWGGQLTAAAIDADPTHFDRVVLIEPGALTESRFDESDVNALNFTASWLQEAMWSYDLFSTDDDARQDYLYSVAFMDSIRSDRHQPVFWRFGVRAFRSTWDVFSATAWDFTSRFVDLPAPALVVAGSGLRDGGVGLGAAFQEEQVGDIENAELAIIEGATHELIETHTDAVVSRIREYLNATDL